jgi:hypothetical protein
MQSGAGVRRHDVEGRRLDVLCGRPLDRAVEDVRRVLVETEDEAAVDHHAERVRATHDSRVVAREVLRLAVLEQVRLVERLEAHEHAAHPRLGSALDQVAAQDGIDGACALEDTTNAPHAGEELAGEAPVAQEMVVQEVDVAPGQPFDLGERGVDFLRIERLAATVEGVLVAEVAVVGTRDTTIELGYR